MSCSNLWIPANPQTLPSYIGRDMTSNTDHRVYAHEIPQVAISHSPYLNRKPLTARALRPNPTLTELADPEKNQIVRSPTAQGLDFLFFSRGVKLRGSGFRVSV